MNIPRGLLCGAAALSLLAACGSDEEQSQIEGLQLGVELDGVPYDLGPMSMEVGLRERTPSRRKSRPTRVHS